MPRNFKRRNIFMVTIIWMGVCVCVRERECGMEIENEKRGIVVRDRDRVNQVAIYLKTCHSNLLHFVLTWNGKFEIDIFSIFCQFHILNIFSLTHAVAFLQCTNHLYNTKNFQPLSISDIFFVNFHSFQAILMQQKFADFSGIWTLIFGVPGEHSDH